MHLFCLIHLVKMFGFFVVDVIVVAVVFVVVLWFYFGKFCLIPFTHHALVY